MSISKVIFNKIRKPLFLYLTILYVTFFISCDFSLKEDDFVGKTYSLGTYHRIEFKTSSRYWIYQRPLGCGGEGNWSIKDGKIVLGANNSQCENTQDKEGIYEFSQFKFD